MTGKKKCRTAAAIRKAEKDIVDAADAADQISEKYDIEAEALHRPFRL